MKYTITSGFGNAIIATACWISSLNEFINHNDKIDAIYLVLVAILFSFPSYAKKENKL